MATQTTQNFTRRQGEIVRFTLEFRDSSSQPIRLASSSGTNLGFYFGGSVTKTGESTIPLQFQYQEVETREAGRGSNRRVENGVFKIWAYLSADTTAGMSLGPWDYAVRLSEAENPREESLDNVRVVASGTITIQDNIVDGGDTTGITYSTPEAEGDL